MAKKSLIAKAARPQKYKTRAYTRCNRCGRPRAVYKKFGLCRICLREMAHAGEHGDLRGGREPRGPCNDRLGVDDLVRIPLYD